MASAQPSNLRPKPRPKLKLKPKPKLKPVKKSQPQAELDAVDEVPCQSSKRERAQSNAEEISSAPNIYQPAAKRLKKTDVALPSDGGNKTTNSRSKPAALRSPLPAHSNRIVNPGAPDQKRKRCTPAEMAAAKMEKEKLKLALENIEKEKIRMLAEMEAAEEEEQWEEERTTIRDVTDLVEPYTNEEGDDYPLDSNNKGRVPDNDVPMGAMESSSDSESEVPAKMQVSRRL
jgi:hypothetical protein